VKPKVSVIMPVHNGEKYIVEAIESGLAQTYSNFELIVVNDGSTDGTYERIRPFLDRIKYVAHPARRGVCAAANTGIENATGKLIAFFDSDDVWLPEKLELQVQYQQEHPQVALVHTDYLLFDEGGILPKDNSPPDVKRAGWIFPELFAECVICANTVMVRRDCLEKVGAFDETLYTGDYDLWLRIARAYEIGYVPRVLTKYRQHPAQLSKTVHTSGPDAEPYNVTVIKKILRLYPEIPQELGESAVRRRMSMLYFQAAYDFLYKGHLSTARKYLREAIRYQPLNLRCYLYYLTSYLTTSQAWALRKLWRRLRAAFEPAAAERRPL
jgi:glycosyltransferase involved in cell wall biosynthesis